MTEKTMTHLYCLMQNRLGAMDRVLNALTHRGIIPHRMLSAIRNEEGPDGQMASKTLELVVSFHAGDEKIVEKLVKFLQKQVYTLDIRTVNEEDLTTETASVSHITPKSVTDLFQNESQRRMAHAHNG